MKDALDEEKFSAETVRNTFIETPKSMKFYGDKKFEFSMLSSFADSPDKRDTVEIVGE